jgi:methyltransferase (TIGR00027 family)
MTMQEGAGKIRDVADTAIWVAYYRARESARPDAMFHDPLAQRLVGERGEQISRAFGPMSRYTEWTVLSRTVNIDDLIIEGLRNGVDAVLNLGAGLDTRPYRMELPAALLWVEADFPRMIEYKDSMLADQAPRCQLQRVAVDLADDAARRNFLQQVAPLARKVLVLTEGLVPYLTEPQVASLAADLRSQPRFAFWLVEYFSARIYPYLRLAARARQMANAPFRFLPPDWLAFFRASGWVKQDIRYPWVVARRFNRRPPMPWFARLLMPFMSKKQKIEAGTATGFLLMVPDAPSPQSAA